MIREVNLNDANRICEIYNYYVLNTCISFETDSVDINEMTNRINKIKEKSYPYIVYTSDDDCVLGYAYCNTYRTRSAYCKTIEISVYVDKNARNMGIGKKLTIELLNRARKNGYHTALSVVTLPNKASTALHKSLGFKIIGRLKEVGYKKNTYRDTSYWQIIL